MNKQELLKILEEWRKYRKSQNHELQYYQLAEVINIVERLDEPQKVKVPKCVAAWIKWNKGRGGSVFILFDIDKASEFEEHQSGKGLLDWMINYRNHDLLIRAWLDGYEVEEEPKWVVKRKDNGKYVESLALGKGIGLIAETTASLQENAYKLNSKDQADAVAVLIDGTVEKV